MSIHIASETSTKVRNARLILTIISIIIRIVHELHNKKASKHGMTIKGKYIH